MNVLITWNYFMQSMILNVNGKERRIQSGIIVNISAVAAVALLWNENLGDRKKTMKISLGKRKIHFWHKNIILCKEIEKLNLVKNARCLDSGHIKTHWHFLPGICMRSQQKFNIKYFENLWDVWWIMPLLILFVVSITFKF